MVVHHDFRGSSRPVLDRLRHHQSGIDAGIALKYWQNLSRSVHSQPRLHCFPSDYQWPRSETTVTAGEDVLEQALRFSSTYDVHLDDLFYAIWAIVASQHTAEGQQPIVFAVSGRDPSIFGHVASDGSGNETFPLILAEPGDSDVISWLRYVRDVRAESSRQSHRGYKEIIGINPAIHAQVKLSIGFGDNVKDVMSEDDMFPLVLNISIFADLKLSLRHNLGVTKMDARVLLDHFLATLQRVMLDPRVSVSSLYTTSPTEKQTLLEYGKAAVRAKSGLVHVLIERQAALTPGVDALQYETDPPVTYLQLNSRANQLARHLRQLEPTFIAVHMLTTVDFIITLLAILKAGAAYVILDPGAQITRKSFMMDDVQARLVIVDDTTAGQLRDEQTIASLLAQSSSEDDGNLVTNQSSGKPAYVIYTSGSTGNPKGVLLEHQAAFNGLSVFPEIKDLRQLLFFNPVFSAAQRSIWATLAVGGCLCLASKENLTVNLTHTINTMNINSIDMTSTTAAFISPEDVPTVRRLALGGEVVSPAVVQTWAHRVELLSSYGLSECTQLNWRYRLRGDTSSRVIGQPFDTTTSYILRPGTTELSPLLVPGELCLGGAQLARGYINSADETARRFIKNPFGWGRLYRTGDMAVRHADGSIEMIGRIDFQVKINGQRIDPGEPNSIIQLHEGVENSAVVPALVNHKMALVAVVVSSVSDWESLVESLRSLLSTRLPLYMIPAFWVPMSALPLNANGKVDMPGIRKLVESSGDLGPSQPKMGNDEAVLSSNERIIRQLWARFLSVPEANISLEDSFLSLGGTSLEAIQVVSRLKFDHGINLKVEDIILGNSLSRVASLGQPDQHSKDAKLSKSSKPFALMSEPSSLELSGLSLANIQDAFPVTPFQEAVIANTMMGGTNYIYSRSYSFSGHAHESVTKSLQSLMRRERFLRTTFVPKGASFLHVVQKAAHLPLETHDVGLSEYLARHSGQLMHPGQLWWRAAILPGGILVLTLHHALFDYWSSEFFRDDLTTLLLGMTPIDRPAFNNYIEHLQEYDDATLQSFWTEYLEGVKPSRLGPHTTSEGRVAAVLRHDIKATASKLNVTPSVLLYAAWSVVLSMTSSTDDVVMGVTLSGRDAPVPGILHMSGPTLMIAPLRIRINTASSFRHHIESVRSSLWEVAKHAQYGLRRILKASGQPRDLFDTMVNFLIKIPSPAVEGGLTPLPENNLGTVEHVKLELSNETLDRISIMSTLDLVFAQTLVDAVATVLDSVMDTPEAQLGQYQLSQPGAFSGATEQPDTAVLETTPNEVDVHETSQVAGADRGDFTSATDDLELAHSSFLRMAALYPWRTAAQDISGSSLTYAGLAIRAHQLASILRSKGVGPEVAVPTLLEKSLNTVVAILGILVSGGAFLPLGPDNPRDRNLGILEESEAKVVITDQQNASFFDDTGYDIVVLDDVNWDSMPVRREAVPGQTADSLAYIIYTSGSTGKPKGTLITHRAVATTVQGITEATDLDSSHRILWALNYIFDGSYDSFFSALSNGSTLCVASQSAIMANLAEVINTMKVTRTNLTPSMTNLFHTDQVPTLRVLVTGGEPITANMQAVFAPRMTVYNAYGPTEATICISTRIVTPDLNPRNIGHPFSRVTALILDPDTMDPVPQGVVGELCVSGAQLARGYLKREDATSKVFHDGPNGRLYQTGDLAKFLPSGEIELYGRKDDQVKINGYRIELGEIETVIMQHDVVEQCVVLAATVLKKKQLVAICAMPAEASVQEVLLLPPECKPDIEQIKKQITTLPKYMIPSIWIPVSRFRFTVNGKIDRKHVQALVEGMADEAVKDYLPSEEAADISSAEELKLRELWSALFETTEEEIHANSTFHALGGDSISALNLGSMLRREGYEIKINDILSSNTLREQAALMVKAGPRSEDGDSGVDIGKEMAYQPTELVHDRLSQLGLSMDDVEDIYPLSPGQIEFLTQGNKPEQFWQLMAVRTLPADFDLDRWISLTSRLTESTQILRALYLYMDDDKDPQTAVQVVLRQPMLNLTYYTYSAPNEKQGLLDTEWETLFDPSKPFVRYSLLTNSVDQTRDLVIKLDHASYDGTLLHILDDQFKALDKGLAIPYHTPFKDFVNHVTSTPKQPQLDYWRNILHDKHFDFLSHVSNPMLSKVDVARIDISVGVDDIAASSGVTAPIVFQAAYSMLLSHLSGSRDVIYDNLVTGRNVALDNPQLIDGNCANFLPFHNHLTNDSTINDFLRQTQSKFWTSTENGLVSLGEIYEALGRDRKTSAAKCLFCFQPFEPAGANQDPMRWIVMKMSKNKMHFNYAVQLEVVKAATKGEYVVRFGYDETALSAQTAQDALSWYVRCLESMKTAQAVRDVVD